MPKFFRFYERLVELKRTHSDIHLQAWSNDILGKLAQVISIYDCIANFLPAEEYEQVQASVGLSEQSSAWNQEESQTILKATKLAYYANARNAIAKKLNGSLFSALRERSLHDAVSLEDESMRVGYISELESTWQRQKYFVHVSNEGLIYLKQVLLRLAQYSSLIYKEIKKHEKDVPVDVVEFAIDFHNAIVIDREKYIDAILDRLECISPNDLSIFQEHRQSLGDRYESDLLKNMLASLMAVGIVNDYADIKLLFARREYQLTDYVVEKFIENVNSLGSDEQQRRLQSLDGSKSRKTKVELSSTRLPLQLREKDEEGEEDEIVIIGQTLGELSAALRDCYFLSSREQATLKCLFDDLKVKDFAVAANWADCIAKFPAYGDLPTSPIKANSPVLQTAEPVQPVKQDPLLMEIDQARMLIADYLVQYPEEESDHSRQGRANHLKMALEKQLAAAEKESNPDKRLEKYNDMIMLLFLHYQSIDYSKSYLSVALENSLISLLNIDSNQISADDCHAYGEAVMKAHAVRKNLFAGCLSGIKQRLFGSTFASDKQNDPLFLFLRDYIIRNKPVLRQLLFVEGAGAERYELNSSLSVILQKLKDKDRAEVAIFKADGLDAASFNKVFTESEPDNVVSCFSPVAVIMECKLI